MWPALQVDGALSAGAAARLPMRWLRRLVFLFVSRLTRAEARRSADSRARDRRRRRASSVVIAGEGEERARARSAGRASSASPIASRSPAASATSRCSITSPRCRAVVLSAVPGRLRVRDGRGVRVAQGGDHLPRLRRAGRARAATASTDSSASPTPRRAGAARCGAWPTIRAGRADGRRRPSRPARSSRGPRPSAARHSNGDSGS